MTAENRKNETATNGGEINAVRTGIIDTIIATGANDVIILLKFFLYKKQVYSNAIDNITENRSSVVVNDTCTLNDTSGNQNLHNLVEKNVEETEITVCFE